MDLQNLYKIPQGEMISQEMSLVTFLHNTLSKAILLLALSGRWKNSINLQKVKEHSMKA